MDAQGQRQESSRAPVATAATGGGRRIRFEPAPAPGFVPDAPASPSPAQLRPVAPADAGAGLRQLLQIEADLRHAASRDALAIALVNETAKLVRARQVFLLRPAPSGRLAVERVSGGGAVEARAPRIAQIEAACAALPAAGDSGPQAVTLDRGDAEAQAYPFAHGLWLPLADRDGRRIGGLLLARETPFDTADAALAARLAETGAHALLALRPRRLPFAAGGLRRPVLAAAGLALLVLAWPSAVTVLAPATVTAERPFVVAAPIDGIVEEIAVSPNAAVRPGDVVVRFVDTAQRNALALAERETQVAEAKLRQVTQGAYVDERARREVGQARAELALKVAERDFAQDVFARTVVRAEREGVAVYADRKDWFGKPVAAGQRILEIADPATVELRIDLPVSDAIALEPGARVRLFLDADPLGALEAEVTQVTPVARITEAGVLAYRVVARLTPGAVARLGAHGTAQLYGATRPFGFTLLRKPLTYLRQKVGL